MRVIARIFLRMRLIPKVLFSIAFACMIGALLVTPRVPWRALLSGPATAALVVGTVMAIRASNETASRLKREANANRERGRNHQD